MSEGGPEEPGGAVGLPDRPRSIDQLPPGLRAACWDFHETSYDQYWDFACDCLGGSHADADEAVDAAFSAIGDEWLRMQTMANPPGFAWRILKFRIENVRRKKRPEPMDPIDLTTFETSADEAAEDPYHQLTRRIAAYQAMQHLTERQRDVLIMTTRLTDTDQETAERMGITPATVRTTRRDAKQKLRQLLATETDHSDGMTS
ncbi:sigma-70 family RNA polymerase sigma factor [Streptomyces sp. NPDC093225]|uniref:sigma-70 family RNA polymerase sigma factor n=1 Tax=Streptomyces sp. NPDC093225 TaxID=3366034 RepID=UPI0037F7A8E4